jgi:predicted GIY-YIG superfamily endonuclease
MIGKIYIIKSKQTNKVYIGSTVDTLKERFRIHKKNKDCSSVEMLKYSDATIELLECYECENKTE